MTDIYVAMMVMIVFSAIIFYLALRIVPLFSKKYFFIMPVTGIIFILLNYLLRNSYYSLKLLPFSNAIVFLNWIFPGAAFLAGLVWGKFTGKKIRTYFYIMFLLIFGFYVSYGHLFKSAPRSRIRIKDGIFLQSSRSSCSAACAATLLGFYGIRTTEKEMIKLCLTTVDGTSLAGLYRGLKLKTCGTPYCVKVEKWPLPHLLNSKIPVILQMQLRMRPGMDPRYATEWGWSPGVSHSVIFLGRASGDKVKIADPSVGRELWSVQGVKDLWHGYVVYLAKRPNF